MKVRREPGGLESGDAGLLFASWTYRKSDSPLGPLGCRQRSRASLRGIPRYLQMSGGVMKSQNFNIVPAHAVNSDVIFMQDQFTRTGETACAAHARMCLEPGHSPL